MKQDNRKGFTLIEMLVVVAIIGLLSSVVVVGVGTARKQARDARRISDIRQIQNLLENYYGTNNKYPAALTDLSPLPPSDPLDGTKQYGYAQLNGSDQSYVLGVCLEGDRPAGVTSVTDALSITNYGSCNCSASETTKTIYCVKT
jgi:prepilin-type N-terminal cleavage/methylation domain-containing protein